MEHDFNFIYEHVIIFEPYLTIADHKLMFELDSATRFISDKKKRLVDSFRNVVFTILLDTAAHCVHTNHIHSVSHSHFVND